jgi:hypothetical protein
MRARCGTLGFNRWVMGAEDDHLPLQCELLALRFIRKHNLTGLLCCTRPLQFRRCERQMEWSVEHDLRIGAADLHARHSRFAFFYTLFWLLSE